MAEKEGRANAACNAADGRVVNVSTPSMGASQYAYQKVTLNGQEHLLRVTLTGGDAMIDLLPGCGKDPKVAISIMGGVVTREIGKNSEMLGLSGDEAARVVEQIRQGFQDKKFSVAERTGFWIRGNPFIREVADLRFERRAPVFKEAAAQLSEFAGSAWGAVLEDVLAGFEHQVQAVERGVAFFEAIDDAQALQVVFETAMALHAVVERVLSRVAERCMAKVVRQRDGLGEVIIDA